MRRVGKAKRAHRCVPGDAASPNSTPEVGTARSAPLPTLIWGLLSQASRLRLGIGFWRFGAAAARGAMRSAACRRGRHAQGLASGDLCSSLHHLISGRTVLARTHIPHACGDEATRMRPIYETALLAPD